MAPSTGLTVKWSPMVASAVTGAASRLPAGLLRAGCSYVHLQRTLRPSLRSWRRAPHLPLRSDDGSRLVHAAGGRPVLRRARGSRIGPLVRQHAARAGQRHLRLRVGDRERPARRLRAQPTGQVSCTYRHGGYLFTQRPTFIVPRTGRITRIRVKSGPSPAKLRLTVLTGSSRVSTFTGRDLPGTYTCCTARYVGRPFRVRANRVTTKKVNVRVFDVRSKRIQHRIHSSDGLALTAVGPGTLPLSIGPVAGRLRHRHPARDLLLPLHTQGRAARGGLLAHRDRPALPVGVQAALALALQGTGGLGFDATVVVADLHAHYPMHLAPGDEPSTLELLGPGARRLRRRDRLRASIVGLLSRFANYPSPDSKPRVTLSTLRAGHVGVAFSVLYSPFDEMDLGQPYSAPPAGRLSGQPDPSTRARRAATSRRTTPAPRWWPTTPRSSSASSRREGRARPLRGGRLSPRGDRR